MYLTQCLPCQAWEMNSGSSVCIPLQLERAGWSSSAGLRKQATFRGTVPPVWPQLKPTLWLLVRTKELKPMQAGLTCEAL